MKWKLIFQLLFLYNVFFAQNIDSIRYVIDSTYSASPFFGNILITKNKKVLIEKSYGYADAVNKFLLSSSNSFQVASISKQFTAYGIMILKSRNLLNYDSLVCSYIPTFPYRNITIRHLLTHTSGLPNFWDEIRPNLDTNKSNGNKEVLEYLIQHKMPLQFEPGTQFQYADIGYDFLATIIENVSGMSYRDFMDQNIFKPLKMNSTYAYMVTDIRRIQNKNLAIGHVFDAGEFNYAHLQNKYNFVFYLGDFYGDGSVVTTVRDLAIWDNALKECKLLPCEIQQESITEPKFNGQILYARTNPNISYGFGWFIKDTPSGKLLYHTGGHPGNSHIMCRLPDKDITFIFLSNAETANIKALRNRILQMLE
ncbi:MAG: beta-lactamase family protein [Bacteroidetes bacterium]|nr:beta-lactamase family protein [Bacteroidota bacterium]